MKRLAPSLVAMLLAAVSLCHAAGKLNVVGATQDLTSIAEEVGGDHITVDYIAKG
jgi:ABC-type Zn uptake system ZnuABC Zn-binding protein ZnuA